LDKAGRAGKLNALRVVSRGIVDDLIAVRYSNLAHTKFRWNQATELGQRKYVAQKLVSALGRPKLSAQLAVQLPKYAHLFQLTGSLKKPSLLQRRKANQVLINVFMALLRGEKVAAANYLQNARGQGINVEGMDQLIK